MTTYDPFTDDSDIVTIAGVAMHLGYVAHRLGIPASTLASLRAGTHVVVAVEILDRFPEINPSNYNDEDVCALNNWGVEVVLAAAPEDGRDGR